MKARRMLMCLCATSVLAATLAVADDTPPLPWVKDSGQEAYREKYLPAATYKAFAISPTGKYAWSSQRETRGKAARVALYFCLKGSRQKCMLYAVDDKLVLDTYATSASEAETALAELKSPARQVYADEDKDTGVAPIAGLKTGKLHEPTPSGAPFAEVVTTARLVELLKAPQRPVVLDVLTPGDNYRKELIPSAAWVSGAGFADDKDNERIDDFFAKFMSDVAPGKDTPIVAYCLDWQCWLSYNALERLSRMGYSRLYWYRGGIEAWQRAGLPTIEAPLAAQVW